MSCYLLALCAFAASTFPPRIEAAHSQIMSANLTVYHPTFPFMHIPEQAALKLINNVFTSLNANRLEWE